jgi:PCFT/HCP family folate transporter-like MFS transporter 1/3
MTDASKTASNFRQDSDGPAATPPTSPWQYISRVRALLFPIEILFLLFLFLVMCFQQISQQYFFQRYARDALANISDFDNVSNVCLKQDDIVNITGSNESFLDIQIKTNNLNMYCEVITLGLSGIMSLFLGTISDRVGRKPILLLDVTGILICIIIQVVIIELELDLRYFLISNVFYGCCGGLGAILGVSFAAVADATKSKRLLAIRMGILESMIGVAKLAAYPTINYWINNNDCEFRYPAYFMIGIGVILAIYALCWPESINKNEQTSSQSVFKGCQKFFNGAKIYLIPSYTGIFTWCKIWIVTAILSLACLSAIGIVEITNYFLHNKPLQWSYDLIGIYGIVNSIAGLIGLSLLLPVLVLIGFPNPLIAIIGAVFGIVANVLTATVKSTWEMFIAGAFQGVRQITFPPMKSTLSGLVQSEDYGSVLSVTASIQMLASVCSTIAFNELYRPQIKIKGTSLDPSIVFWITAGVWGAIIPLSMLLFFKKKKPISIQLADEKTLLASNNSNYGINND